MSRLITLFALLFSCTLATPAMAAVEMHFHSFNGSLFFGRYPHTFVVLEGTLDETGRKVNENYGFSAKEVTTAILSGPVEHMILVEESETIPETNRHFSITLTDDQYRQVVAQMRAWKFAPGKYYNLESRNCIHFVGEIARLVGLKVEYPDNMLRRPKRWLNHITDLNPQLRAEWVD